MAKWRVYLAGPMTGYPQWNHPAFHAAAKAMRAMGIIVTNPAETAGGRTDLGREYYMRINFRNLMKPGMDSVVLLPGWRRSSGALAEIAVAKQLGLCIVTYPKMSPVDTESILLEADELVDGDRGDDYGHPLVDFGRTAQLWGPILGVGVTAEQVGLCQIQIKVSRYCHKPKRDSLTDIAGYAKCIQKIAEKKAGFFPQSQSDRAG